MFSEHFVTGLCVLVASYGKIMETRVSDMLCFNGSLLDLYIYVNYSILYSYGQINMSLSVCLSVCL